MTKIDIVNMALGKIGNGIVVSSLAENTQQMNAVNTVWGAMVEEVMGAKPWHFARMRAALTRIVGTTPAFGWLYAYDLPSGFVCPVEEGEDYQALSIGGLIAGETTIIHVPYSIENILVDIAPPDPDVERVVLLTNYLSSTEYPLYLAYIKSITDETKWPGYFISVFTFRLAAEVSLKLTEGISKYQGLMKLYDIEKSRGYSISQKMKDIKNKAGESSWVDAGRG